MGREKKVTVKLVKHFDAFLKHRVNLSDKRIEQLDARVSAVSKFLSTGNDVIAENFVELIPQGSYAQRTIINPVAANDEFDADVLLEMKEVSGWEPEHYVQELYTAFKSNATYKGMVARRTRCVVVDYANEFHIDVVPYVERHSDHYITNKKTNQFELTNPEGFTFWMDEQNRISSGRLVKVIRLAKYLRDFKNNFSVKSVILTILLGERVSDAALWSDPDHYKDIPSTLLNLFEDLDSFLQDHELMPSIDDPSCPTENFNHRWDESEYANFRKWIHIYAAWIRDAYDETDRDESYRKWRRLFGDEFGTHGEVTKSSEAHLALSSVRNTDETLQGRWGIPIELNSAYKVKLLGRVRRQAGWRHYDLPARGNVVGKRVTIDFRIAANNVPAPFEVYWKVRNNGTEAYGADNMRGQVERDGGSQTRSEPTAYKGSHYVEVFIVKSGVCVAFDHQPVIVR